MYWCCFCSIICSPLDQVTQQLEDKRFMEYLESEGYDISELTAYDFLNEKHLGCLKKPLLMVPLKVFLEIENKKETVNVGWPMNPCNCRDYF